MRWQIRPEEPRDRDAVRAVNTAAFPEPAEADLVDALRLRGKATVSLVADVEGAVVGHILFSPLTLDPACDRSLLGLAPMAVLPAHQRTGIGSALVTAGLGACAARGAQAVLVLGHADYYPRFGFRPASGFGLRSTYDVPDANFLALELVAGALDGVAGTVHYAPEFAGV